MVTVPTDKDSPRPERRQWVRPEKTEGEVCLERYGRKEVADVTQVILADNGVPARVASDDGGGTVPIGVLGGHRVMIDVKDWDRAVEIMQQIRLGDAADAPRSGPPPLDPGGQAPGGQASNRRPPIPPLPAESDGVDKGPGKA